MELVLIKAMVFVTIIIMGYLLKRKGFFQKKDFYLLSKIVIRITLPAAIVFNFSSITMELSLLMMCVLGFLCNVFMVFLGYLINKKRSVEEKAFGMVNISGYNIGNFTMPFVQNFLGPVGFAATSLFDAGNSVMCTGLTYASASVVLGKGEKASFLSIIKKLFSSIPFDAYVIMTILAVLKIQLPGFLLNLAEVVGKSNTFLALLSIGIGFELTMDRSKISKIVKILSMRYGTAVLISVGLYFFAPFSLEVRQTLAIVTLSPIASVAPAFTGLLGGDVEMSSVINSLSIVLSVIGITVALLLIL